ncbi:dynein axonemal light chain 4-like [Lethenteron reissneri]|uniref:dynein axonemal light chain 4-like n=1 Tax=Lethenteron reissneri TaxID=7753 RepID=UPI002AB6101B|nr:dynein axonemal light chain 4-like [Lethenteron reissneri]
MAQGAKGKSGVSFKWLKTQALVQYSDMAHEMRTQAVELCLNACEQFSSDQMAAARIIKESMDKTFGCTWHVVVGETYAVEVVYEPGHLLYFYYGGHTAVCVWKCD